MVSCRRPIGKSLICGYFTARHSPLEKTPHKTRVEYFDAMPAPIALIEMTTQDRCPAVPNIVECFPLLAREHGVPASQEIVLVGAEDIGQFQPMLFHYLAGRRRNDSSDSSGLVVARTFTSATCR
jgi:hypothetical protein